jgi:uncharacterized membrane protein YcaP (DUF421 family)
MDWIESLFLAKGSDLDPITVIPRTAIVFLAAVLYVRWAKKRFIAQASAIDLVMAVVFGSLLSRAVNGGATLLSSLSAGFTLVALHRVVMHFSARWPWLFDLVKGHKEVIVENGRFVRPVMLRHDVTEEDVRQEMRTRALTDNLDEIELGILERSGKISIIKKGNS